MAITRTAFYTLYSTATSETAALALGANPGRAVLGYVAFPAAYNITGAEIKDGDALAIIASESVDGYKRYLIGGMVTQTGDQIVRLLTDIPVDVYPLRWGNFVAYDGAASVRAGGVVNHGWGAIASLTPANGAGDMLVMLGITSGAGAHAAGSGGSTDFDGGAGDTIAVQRTSGAAGESIAAAWTPASAWYAGAAALVPIGGAPAGPTITGPATFNLAENATAGPTFTTDIDLDSGYPQKAGADAALFNLVSTGTRQWQFQKIAAGNYEAPDDAGANRVYDVTFAASAGVTASCAITLTNVAEPPNAPTIGTATAGDATVTINGTPGAANGGPSVTSYTATLSPGSITKAGASLPIVFTSADGVVNGTAYTGTLTATNSEGTSAASAASNSVTPVASGGGGVKVPAVLLSRLLTPRS